MRRRRGEEEDARPSRPLQLAWREQGEEGRGGLGEEGSQGMKKRERAVWLIRDSGGCCVCPMTRTSMVAGMVDN